MRAISVLVFVFIACTSHSTIYTWTDSDGRIHYSENPNHQAEEVNLNTKVGYSSGRVPTVKVKTPIKSSLTQTFALDRIQVNKDFIKQNKSIVGSEICQEKRPIYYKNNSSRGDDLRSVARKTLLQHNYATTDTSYSALLLKPSIETVLMYKCTTRIDRYSTKVTSIKTAAHVKVKWELIASGKDQPLYVTVTEGSFNGLDNAREESEEIEAMAEAIRMAVTNLIADDQFIDFIRVKNTRKALPKVEQLEALRYTNENTFTSIGLEQLTLSDTAYMNGKLLNAKDICHPKKNIDLKFEDSRKNRLSLGIQAQLKDNNYNVRRSNKENYSLIATVNKLKIERCVRRLGNEDVELHAYLTIEWTLKNNKENKKEFSYISEGSFSEQHASRFNRDLSKAIEKSIEMATNNLLANPEFSNVISNLGVRDLKSILKEKAPLELTLLEDNRQSEENASRTMNNSVFRMADESDELFCTLLSENLYIICPTVRKHEKEPIKLKYKNETLNGSYIRSNDIVSIYKLNESLLTEEFTPPNSVFDSEKPSNAYVVLSNNELHAVGYQTTIYGVYQSDGYHFALINGEKYPNNIGLLAFDDNGVFIGLKLTKNNMDVIYTLQSALSDLNITYEQASHRYKLNQLIKRTTGIRLKPFLDWLNEPLLSNTLSNETNQY